METCNSNGACKKQHTRQANFELLRVKAMLMVVVLHYLSKGGLLLEFGKPWQTTAYAAWLLEAFCVPGVNVFVLLSGYFLMDSKFRIRRLVTLWLQVFSYSAGIAALLFLTGAWKLSDLTVYALMDYIFPIQTEHYWFATAYFFMYLFSPFLLSGMKAMTQKQHKTLLLALLAAFSVPKSLIPLPLAMDRYGYDALWFLCLLVLAGYMRRYGIAFFTETAGLSDKKKMFWRSIFVYAAASLSIFAIFMAAGGLYQATGKLADLAAKPFQYNHLLNLIASVALFYAFSYYEAKEKLANIICAVSPYVFGVYLLHEHIGLRYAWPQWFRVRQYGQTALFVPHLLATISAVFAAGILVDYGRSRLFSGIGKLAARLIKPDRQDEDRS